MSGERVTIELPPYATPRDGVVMVYCRTRREFGDLVEWALSQGRDAHLSDGGSSLWWLDPDVPGLSWSARKPRDAEHEEHLDYERLAERYRG